MDKNPYYILNKLFSKTTFDNLILNYDYNYIKNCAKSLFEEIELENKTYNEIIQVFYKLLNNNYRNEYFYKNTILNKLLLGRHSIRTTTALNEIPVLKSKADFILINGKATVYEIKSDIDNLGRLNSQLKDYLKAFNHIYIVTNEYYAEKLLYKLKNKSIGIIVLTKRGHLSERRKAIIDNSNLNHRAIFKILRKYEYENIIKKIFSRLPNVSQIKYYEECYKLIKTLNVVEFYNLSIKELKNRKKVSEIAFKEFIPYELKHIAYFSNFDEEDYFNINRLLNTKYRG